MRSRLAHLTVPLLIGLSIPLGDALAQQPPHIPVPVPTVPVTGTLASAMDAVQTSDYARAEKELAMQTGANKPPALIALARISIDQGKWAEADKFALQAFSTHKKAEAIALRAEIMFLQGKRDDAIKLLEANKSESGEGGREIKLLLGEYRILVGKRADAEAPLMDIIGDYNADKIDPHDANGLAIAGRAANLLRAYKNAAQLFNESKRADATNVRRALWEAEIFLDKYDPGHSEENAKAALSVAPHSADALVMMARIKLAQSYDFDAADKLVAQALAVNPKHAGAHAVKSGLALRDMNITGADQAMNDGLANSPADLELLSMKAAIRFLADDAQGYENAKKDVLAKNAEYSKFYAIVADYAEWEHRYDDIVTMMKEATKVDPEDGKAWADLGIMQTRQGDEQNGLDALRKAFSKDKYNIYVYNTLNLYEKQIAFDYDLVDDGPFKIRYPKNEEAVLTRYVPRMLGEAFASMKSRYGFTPTLPVQIELYSNREQFSVRTSGLPNIGIQGVCFGKLLAAMSPASEPFNWGNVVWHELGHVFAIQLSKNHVPRWFTEGLSEYETISRRPEWQRELDPQLYQSLKKNKLPGAVDMNRVFTHAKDGNDVTVAYYAASQMMVFTAERFGMPKIAEALKAWGTGLKTADVIQKAFGVSAADYDKQYREWQLKRLSRYDGQFMFDDSSPDLDDAVLAAKAKPNDAEAQVDLALASLKERKKDDAQKAIEQALRLDPNNKRAHFMAAKLAGSKKDFEGMQQHLAMIQKAGGDGYEIRSILADLAEAHEDKKTMRAQLEAAYAFDPMQSDPLKGLFDLAKEEKRDADALDILKRVAPLEQHDHDVWRMLLDRLVAAQQWDEVRKWGEGAVYVDVHRPGTHIAYARGLIAGGDHARAIFELESALLCKSNKKDANKEQASAHALLAKELTAVGRKADADTHLAQAKQLDPANDDLK